MCGAFFAPEWIMDQERRDAIKRLSTRLGRHVYGSDPEARGEGFWALYLPWLLHEQTDPGIKEEARGQRSRAVSDLDRLYGRQVECHDLTNTRGSSFAICSTSSCWCRRLSKTWLRCGGYDGRCKTTPCLFRC